MNKTTALKFTNNGRRAYRFERMRWFPICMAEAQLLLASGQAEDWTGREDQI